MLQSGDAIDELRGHDLVVAHAHLAGGEDAEVVLGEVAEGVDVELHSLVLAAAQGVGCWHAEGGSAEERNNGAPKGAAGRWQESSRVAGV